MKAISMEEKIANCLRRHPDWKDLRVANTCTCHVGEVRRVRSKQKGRKEAAIQTKQRGKTLQQFRAQFDVR